MSGGGEASPDAGRPDAGSPDTGSPDTGSPDAWSPGIESEIPRRLQPAITLFRAENASLSRAEVDELSDLCGLPAQALAALRPERLVVHELLVRVTADLSVPDGPNYADLGISLRSMVARLFEHHVAPEMPRLIEAFEAELERAGALVERELADAIGVPATAGDPDRAPAGGVRGWLARLFGESSSRPPSRSPPRPASMVEPPERRALQRWRERLADGGEPLERACLAALIRTVDGIVGRRGRLFADIEPVRRIALVLIGNERGAELIAERIGPPLAAGIVAEGYRRLPVQDKPVIMNVKGASASGKSTIRPQQRALAASLGLPWEDFALISPDYWRKYLLDYDSLGEDHRYGAMLTGQELEIVDRKLDRHMAAKASRGEMSHLLIDRFRFDSFTLAAERTADSRLLTRFGDRVFLFFMVTPPTETVERAWTRGLSTGRYKAVSDLLFHNVEAFTGMPALFLSWVHAQDKRVHFEFLDNDVPEGTLPRTAAFGWNDTMVILDVELMLDVDRYRKVDVEARRPEEVLAAEDLSAAGNLEFVRRCAATIGRIDFADRDSARVYARIEGGRLTWWDESYLDGAGEGVREALGSLGHRDGTAPAGGEAGRPVLDVERERQVTVGRWGPPSVMLSDVEP